MLDKCVNQSRPFVVIGRRSAIGSPPECRAMHGRERSGRKTQLNKRAYTLCQHSVIQIVHVLEVIGWNSLLILAIDKHVVLEYSVKTYILKSVELCRCGKFFLPGGPKAFVGATSADYLAPEVHKAFSRHRGISVEMNGGIAIRAGRWRDLSNQYSGSNKDDETACLLCQFPTADRFPIFHSPYPLIASKRCAAESYITQPAI